jgi:hypothetical protein
MDQTRGDNIGGDGEIYMYVSKILLTSLFLELHLNICPNENGATKNSFSINPFPLYTTLNPDGNPILTLSLHLNDT